MHNSAYFTQVGRSVVHQLPDGRDVGLSRYEGKAFSVLLNMTDKPGAPDGIIPAELAGSVVQIPMIGFRFCAATGNLSLAPR
jgi:hypothetical protein